MQLSTACVQTSLYTQVLIQEYEINAAFLLTRVPEGLHRYLWRVFCIVCVRRTKMAMSYSAEWEEII